MCLASADTNGFANAGGMASDPVISDDGRYVVFRQQRLQPDSG